MMDEMKMKEDAGIFVPMDGIELPDISDGETFELPARFKKMGGRLMLVEVAGKVLENETEDTHREEDEGEAMEREMKSRAMAMDKERMM